MIADAAPADLRGTAYGFFSLTTGIAMLAASGIAGLLWSQLGAAFTFYAGAAFGATALVGLVWQPRPSPPDRRQNTPITRP
jgi:MFS family permease